MITNELAEKIRKQKKHAFYFRYPLHSKDFHELRDDNRLLGYYTAKPLYGKLTSEGRVDRMAGYNGEIAIIFLPSPARSAGKATLLFTKVSSSSVMKNGKRNWKAIHEAAEERIRSYIAEEKE